MKQIYLDLVAVQTALTAAINQRTADYNALTPAQKKSDDGVGMLTRTNGAIQVQANVSEAIQTLQNFIDP